LRLFIATAIFTFLIHFTCGYKEQEFQLNDGNAIPVVGLGTSTSKGDEGVQAIKDAIDIGYRHIDTAYASGTEVDVGKAIQAKIADGTIKREDIFVATKLWGTFHEPEWVHKQFEASLSNLNLTYIDLYLMHTPTAYQRLSKTTNSTAESVEDTILFGQLPNGKRPALDVDYVDTWKKMEELVGDGRVKSLGVSNFNSEQLNRLNDMATIKPTVNQVECHANLNQRKLIEFSKERNIITICYSPLGRPDASSDKKLAINDPIVLQLAKKYNKSPAQIVLRYSHQNGAVVIPRSQNKQRIQENIDVFDFALNDEDMQAMHSLNNNYRILSFIADTDNKHFPFNIEF